MFFTCHLFDQQASISVSAPLHFSDISFPSFLLVSPCFIVNVSSLALQASSPVGDSRGLLFLRGNRLSPFLESWMPPPAIILLPSPPPTPFPALVESFFVLSAVPLRYRVPSAFPCGGLLPRPSYPPSPLSSDRFSFETFFFFFFSLQSSPFLANR